LESTARPPCMPASTNGAARMYSLQEINTIG
jgi:hypothetical protein